MYCFGDQVNYWLSDVSFSVGRGDVCILPINLLAGSFDLDFGGINIVMDMEVLSLSTPACFDLDFRGINIVMDVEVLSRSTPACFF